MPARSSGRREQCGTCPDPRTGGRPGPPFCSHSAVPCGKVSGMKSLTILAAGILVPVLGMGLGACASNQSTAADPQPSEVVSAPAGGEAEAFCQQVDEFMTDMKALETEMPTGDNAKEIEQQAQDLADKATKLSTDLSRDPDELQKVQECLGQLTSN